MSQFKSDPREPKLPVWAQDLLYDARKRADTAEHRLAAHLETVEETPIWYGERSHPLYVPFERGYQTVHFQLGPGHFNEIQARIKDGAVEIMGGHELQVTLQSSNVFHVKGTRT